ncbi:Laccase-2 [Lachnellula suecica]|uniref:Laccase-2 n=1 Tax=Lachnellula suecica TaxID=602035 RepID=A0A8T9CCZ6_9HELO|nr:Laccase-2 [Lachnellula suecica]
MFLLKMAPKWTAYLLVALLISSILSFGLDYRGLFAGSKLFHIFESSFSDAKISEESGISIPLHPEEHISRAPRTIQYRWDITQGYQSPDGVRKLVYLINGVFPGPTIEARSGDDLRIKIHNLLEHEGVAFHWHGLHMRGKKTLHVIRARN